MQTNLHALNFHSCCCFFVENPCYLLEWENPFKTFQHNKPIDVDLHKSGKLIGNISFPISHIRIIVDILCCGKIR